MPSVKQLKQEIIGAEYFTPQQKEWLTKGINRALEVLAQKEINAPSKPRTVKKAKGLVTLNEWETANGRLDTDKLDAWIKARSFDKVRVAEMLSEFRSEMMAKGKQYADFRATFQVYLAKGYLSKPASYCVKQDSSTTTIHSRGGQL